MDSHHVLLLQKKTFHKMDFKWIFVQRKSQREVKRGRMINENTLPKRNHSKIIFIMKYNIKYAIRKNEIKNVYCLLNLDTVSLYCIMYDIQCVMFYGRVM